MASILGDKPINRIGFGAMQLAGPGVFGPPRDPEGARAVLRRAVELGVEDNLRTLRRERMDLVNLRLFDEHDSDGRLAEQLGALQDLRQEGKLDLIGLSNATADTARRGLELADIACVQNAFSVVNRADGNELELCEERGLAFVPFFPLGSAFAGGPKQLAADPAIAEVAAPRASGPAFGDGRRHPATDVRRGQSRPAGAQERAEFVTPGRGRSNGHRGNRWRWRTVRSPRHTAGCCG